MQGPHMTPSGSGTVVYLSAGSVDSALEKAAEFGGKVVVPKTPIGAGEGFFARFLDPEGNIVGLCGPA